MPIYKGSPFQVPLLAMKGVPTYLFGAFNYEVGNSNMALSNVALTTNVATVTVQIINGPSPVVGGLISIINSTNSAGLFNVSRVPITAVNINQTTGTGTVSFALTNANVTSIADTGTVIVEPAEVPETLTNNSFSIPCVIQAPEGDSQFTVPIAVTFPTIPTAATVTLQRALYDNNAEYTNTAAVVTVAASAYTAGPTVLATLERANLYRFAVTGVTGSGTIVAKVGN